MRFSFIKNILISLSLCLISFIFCSSAFAQETTQDDSSVFTDKSSVSVFIGASAPDFQFPNADIGVEYLYKFNDIWRFGASLDWQTLLIWNDFSILFMNEFSVVKAGNFEFSPRVGLGISLIGPDEIAEREFITVTLVDLYVGFNFDWRISQLISLGLIIKCDLQFVVAGDFSKAESDSEFNFISTPSALFNVKFHF